MISLLIVSADPQAVQQIEQLAVARGIRVRSVAAVDTAKEWLSMQSFDMLLVDGRYKDESPIQLIELAWKYNPLTDAGLFNFSGAVADEWTARIMGARVYAGPKSLATIENAFNAMPERIAIGDEHYVLYVEDLDSPRDIITSYVQMLGYPNIEPVSSGSEALRLLNANPEKYFCVLADINMPEMTGLELLAQIRSQPTLEHLPVLMLTAHASVDNLIDCIKKGASGFLVKPPRKKALRAELEKARRLFLTKRPPRLCREEDAHLLEDALLKLGLRL